MALQAPETWMGWGLRHYLSVCKCVCLYVGGSLAAPTSASEDALVSDKIQ